MKHLKFFVIACSFLFITKTGFGNDQDGKLIENLLICESTEGSKPSSKIIVSRIKPKIKLQNMKHLNQERVTSTLGVKTISKDNMVEVRPLFENGVEGCGLSFEWLLNTGFEAKVILASKERGNNGLLIFSGSSRKSLKSEVIYHLNCHIDNSYKDEVCADLPKF